MCKLTPKFRTLISVLKFHTNFVFVGGCDVEKFMNGISVRDLPGVGRVIAEKLRANYSVDTCEHLQKISLQTLKQDLGVKTGQSLYNLARGKDDKPNLDFSEERKSVSTEVNYGIRFSTIPEAEKFIFQLSEEVIKRLLDISSTPHLKAKQLTLKVMIRSENAPIEPQKFLGHGMCESFSKSVNLSSATSDANVIKRESMVLLKMLLKSNVREVNDLRGIGIQLTKFEKGSKQTENILNFINRNVGNNCALPTKYSVACGETSSSTIKTKPNNNSATLNDLSISQIDQDMLDSLPKDIKDEIMQSMSIRQKEDDLELKDVKKFKSNESAVKSMSLANISFSQFDPNVLSELPIELQDELRAQFSSKTKNVPSAFDKIMATTSNRHCLNLQTSPVNLRGKRGRPPKNSPKIGKHSNKAINNGTNRISPPRVKQCLFNEPEFISDEISRGLGSSECIDMENFNAAGTLANSATKTLNNLLASNINSSDTLPIDTRTQLTDVNTNTKRKNSKQFDSDHEININSERTNILSDENNTTQCTEESLDASNDNQAAVLESKNCIEELRPLFRKWIKSFVTPTYDDVETIINYFKLKIKENKLELVHMGLKSLCRTCLSSEHPENWTGAYNGIVREIQRTMLMFYGKRLSVNFKF